MKFCCIGTGSIGNCYSLTDSAGNILLLDAGLPIKEIKRGINYRVSSINGAVITHHHKDHELAVNDLDNMGIKVICPYSNRENYPQMACTRVGNFGATAFAMMNSENHFVHTNGDGSECPIYGYLIDHREIGRLLYITDAEYVRYRFTNIDHLLLGVNYDGNVDSPYAKHVMKGHMSLETAKGFIKSLVDNGNTLSNIIICHTSGSNADAEYFTNELSKVANRSVLCAYKGMTTIL